MPVTAPAPCLCSRTGKDCAPVCNARARTLPKLLDRKEIVHSPTSPQSHSRPSTQKSHEHPPWPLTLYRAFLIVFKYIFPLCFMIEHFFRSCFCAFKAVARCPAALYFVACWRFVCFQKVFECFFQQIQYCVVLTLIHHC